MAVDNKQIAQDVLAAVGGAANVTSATHCITRLRLNLKDQSVPNDDEVKKIKGVLGAQWSGGQYQIIIGQNVPKVYAEALKLGIPGEGAIDENLDPGMKQPLTPKTIGMAILNYVSKSMVQIIPIMMAAAFCRTVAMVCGPNMLNLWATDSDLYTLFNTWLFNAGFYFLPISLGWACARQLGASPQLGMLMGGVLIMPEFVSAVAAATEAGVDTISIYGLPAAANNYSSTVLPIVLCMPVLWQIEKFLKRVIPDMLATVFVPFLTLLIMVPIALVVLAPIGGFLGDLVGAAMFNMGASGGIMGILATIIIAACWEFLVMTGMHQLLITLCIAQLANVGFDSVVCVGGNIASWAAWGMGLGAFLRLREKDARSMNLGFFISGIIGGVTEPVLYGCGFKYPRAFAGMVIGGAIGGAICAVLGVSIYTLGASNFLNLIGFVGGNNSGMSLTVGIIGSVVALLSSAAITYFFGFKKEDLEEDRRLAAENK